MFFKETYSRNSKTPVLQLVENIRTDKGPRQRVVVSLGTYFKIPKSIRKSVARIVKERLLGQLPLFLQDPKLIACADKVVKKIQTEGKWNCARERVCKFVKKTENNRTAEVFIDEVSHGYSRELGAVLIGHNFWERLNFPGILKECGFNERQIKTAEISVLNRLIAQDSEHSIISWLQTVAVDELLGIDTSHVGDDRFYRISDKLLKNQGEIEETLYQREKDLFSLEDSVFLYDLTNTYFEGVCAGNLKAEYNKNQKEKRSDCPQVVVALVLDGDGFIRRHRMFPGKMSDAKSLKEIILAIEEEFQESRMPTIIFDRGMVTDDNISLLTDRNDLKFIVMCRSGEEALFTNEFENEEFSIIEGRDSKPEVKVFLKETNDTVYLLCKSEGRKAKERAMRTSREKKFEAELSNLKEQIRKGKSNIPSTIEQRIGRIKERYSSVSKYYKTEYNHWNFSYTGPDNIKVSKRFANSLNRLGNKAKENKITFPAVKKKLAEFKAKYPSDYSQIDIHLKEAELKWWTIDEEHEKERLMDGNYLLKTNRKDLTADEIWKMYVMLTRIENAFRDLKSYLGLRPNNHQTEKRVDGHIFISILGYHLLHSIEFALRQTADQSRWGTIKRLVSTHNYSTIQLPTTNGTVINVRKAGIPEGVQIEIYKKLGVAFENLPVRRSLA
jgi:transposase